MERDMLSKKAAFVSFLFFFGSVCFCARSSPLHELMAGLTNTDACSCLLSTTFLCGGWRC